MGDVKMLLLVLLPVILAQSASAYRILGLFPLQGKSHFNMMQPLMIELSKKHQVDVVSHFPLKTPIPNYHDISLNGSMPQLVNSMTAERLTLTRSLFLSHGMKAIGSDVCDLLDHPELQKLIHHPPNDPPYDAVIFEV